MGDAFIRSFYGPITEHEACGRRHGNNVSVVLTGLPLLLFLYLLLLLFLFSYSSLLLLRSCRPSRPTVQQPTFSLFRVVLSVRETARRFVPDKRHGETRWATAMTSRGAGGGRREGARRKQQITRLCVAHSRPRPEANYGNYTRAM